MTASTQEQQKITVPYYDKEGKRLKGLELPESAFGGKIHRGLLFDAVLMYEANLRQGDSNTLTRAEVRGTIRKPWRQKGTGRARAGTNKSPIWRGGGIVFGPHPRDYSYSMPKQQKRIALRSALLSKFVDREVRVIEDFVFEAPKTRKMQQLLSAMGVSNESCLVGLPQFDETVAKSLRNIPRSDLQELRNLNAHLVLKHRKLVLTKSAYDALLKEAKDE